MEMSDKKLIGKRSLEATTPTTSWLSTYSALAGRTPVRAMIWIVVVAMLFVGCSQKKSERLTFAAGTYEVTAQGHNGDIVFDELIPQIIKANGTGVDAMTGATGESRGRFS